MLLLCFSLGDERFAVDAAKVQRILPLVRMKQIPKAPAWMAGLMRYHDRTVPVVDLCALNLARKAERRLSTRIILVHFTDREQQSHPLGLLAEQVDETVRRQATDFTATGVDSPETPYLGGVAGDGEGMLQWVEIDRLLPDDVQQLLFQSGQEAAA